MHTFFPDRGISVFAFSAAPYEQVWLAGDFNGWGRIPLPMSFHRGQWVISVRLPAGEYHYGFVVRDGLYGFAKMSVPLWFGRMTKGWLEQAARVHTCDKHFWKWN